MSMEVDADDTGVLLIISLVALLSLGYEGGRPLRRGGLYLRNPALSS